MNHKGDICPMCEKGILIEEIFNRSVFTHPKRIDGDAKVFIIFGSKGTRYARENGELHLICNKCPYGVFMGYNSDPNHP